MLLYCYIWSFKSCTLHLKKSFYPSSGRIKWTKNNDVISIFQLFVEDSLGERLFVDQESCKSFVDNIMTAFSSKSVPTLEMEGRPELADDPEAVSLSTGPSSSMAKEYYEYIPVTNRWGYYKVGSCREYSLLFGSAMVVQMIISRKFRWQQQVTWMK